MHIPDDILTTILCKLDVKNLCKAESVSKKWKLIIENKIWIEHIWVAHNTYASTTSKGLYKKFFHVRKDKLIYRHDFFYLVGEPTIIKDLLEKNVSATAYNDIQSYKMTKICRNIDSRQNLILKNYSSINNLYLFDNLRDAEIYSNDKSFREKGVIYLAPIFKVKLHANYQIHNVKILVKDIEINCIEVKNRNSLSLVSAFINDYYEEFKDLDNLSNITKRQCSIS